MEQVRQEEVGQVGEEVSAAVAVVAAGWEVPVLVPGPVGNASALIVGRAYHIRWAIPAITGIALNAEQKWGEVKKYKMIEVGCQ